jgi:Glycine rich protein
MMVGTNVSRRRVVPPALGAACRHCPERAGRRIGEQLLEQVHLASGPSRIVAFDRSCGGADPAAGARVSTGGIPMSRSAAMPLSLRATLAALAGALCLGCAILLSGGAAPALAAPSCTTSGANTVCTFSTPGADTFTVPAGVTEASFDVFGAQGGGLPGQSVGGLGGRARAELALTPRATVTVVVGGAGGPIGACDAQETPGAGGVNGGASGGSGFCEGAGGGGASDVRIGGSSLFDRVLVAGGGGGGANRSEGLGDGGAGGGLSGGPAGDILAGGGGGRPCEPGTGGDQTGTSGSCLPGDGSAGADGTLAGGGGGGGFYGGAGGRSLQGGGGGSGFGPPGVVFEIGVRGGDGRVTITYAEPVAYSFTGFFSPVDSPPMFNTVKAGASVPVKFSLAGDQGLGILAAGSPASQRIACESSAPLDPIEETATPGGSGLQYNALTDQYTYVWKTEKGWANSCRQLNVKLDDGSDQRASFQFR